MNVDLKDKITQVTGSSRGTGQTAMVGGEADIL